MDTASALVTIALSASLIVLGGSLVRSPTDLVLVYLLVFTQFYWLRPALFAVGLDTPSPAEEFFSAEVPGLVTETVLGLTLFLLVTLLTTAFYQSSGLPAWGPCFSRGPVRLDRLVQVVAALTILAGLVSAFLVATHGGVGGLITAAKADKALAGLFALRAVPSVGAVVAVGGFLEAHGRRAGRTLSRFMLLCAIANAFFVFLWGSRSLLVVLAAVVVLGLRRNRAHHPVPLIDADPEEPAPAPGSGAPRGRIITRLVVATLCVVVAAGGLRVVRDDLMHGEVLDVYAEASVWRQMSLATNATYFDAAMLSFRDWPDRHDYRHGEDFATGLVAFVPRLVWEGKPASIAPGRWFRQVYQSDKINGWPMGAGALWYLNFGWLGILLGGLLSGVLLGAMTKAQRRRPDHGLNRAIGVMIGVFVIGLGWDSDTLLRLLIWVVPLWVIARYVSPVSEPHSSPANSPIGPVRVTGWSD